MAIHESWLSDGGGQGVRIGANDTAPSTCSLPPPRLPSSPKKAMGRQAANGTALEGVKCGNTEREKRRTVEDDGAQLQPVLHCNHGHVSVRLGVSATKVEIITVPTSQGCCEKEITLCTWNAWQHGRAQWRRIFPSLFLWELWVNSQRRSRDCFLSPWPWQTTL